MGLTRVQLISRVRSRLSAVSDDALLTQDVLYECINDGIQAYADERDWPWLEAITTVSLTQGTKSYSLPSDFVREHTVDIDGAVLTYVQYKEFLSMTGTTQSQPRYFTTVGDTLYVSPAPNQAYTLNLHYQRAERALANDTDQTYAPARRASLLATYSAIYAAVKVRDEALTSSLYKLRDDELKRAIDDVQRGTLGPRIDSRPDTRL